MTTTPLVAIEGLDHHYGAGVLRKQILFEIGLAVRPGEIVILTGPSGSGKTTLLTLIGALRRAQKGSLRVLDEEIRDATEAVLIRVRRQIGYIFQLHNLVPAFTVEQNVMVGLGGRPVESGRQARVRIAEMLASVGLEAHARRYPEQLSGGQKQRVAIARALIARPRVILADEPTASLDKTSGREVVDRLHDLAKRDGAAVLLVTHDNRILDIADRLVHLEEGRLSGFGEALLASTHQFLGTVSKSGRRDEMLEKVADMAAPRFREFLEGITAEAQRVLQVMTMGTDDAFEIMLAQTLEVCTHKIGRLFEAERCSLLLGDDARGELWSKVVQTEGGRPVDIRIPIGTGVAGHVYRTGETVNVPDAYEHPLFNPEVDRQTGYRTRSVLCTRILDSRQRPLAVMTLLNKRGGDPFDDRDAQTFRDFAASMGVVLETWNEASRARDRRRGDDAVAS